MWNDQTGATKPIAAAQSGLTVYVTGLLPQRLPDTLLSSRVTWWGRF